MEEQLFDPNTQVVETDQEIIVHWVNKYGVGMDIKTRKGGLIHALWLQENERRSRKQLDGAIDIETEICQEQLPDASQSNP